MYLHIKTLHGKRCCFSSSMKAALELQQQCLVSWQAWERGVSQCALAVSLKLHLPHSFNAFFEAVGQFICDLRAGWRTVVLLRATTTLIAQVANDACDMYCGDSLYLRVMINVCFFGLLQTHVKIQHCWSLIRPCVFFQLSTTVCAQKTFKAKLDTVS